MTKICFNAKASTDHNQHYGYLCYDIPDDAVPLATVVQFCFTHYESGEDRIKNAEHEGLVIRHAGKEVVMKDKAYVATPRDIALGFVLGTIWIGLYEPIAGLPKPQTLKK